MALGSVKRMCSWWVYVSYGDHGNIRRNFFVKTKMSAVSVTKRAFFFAIIEKKYRLQRRREHEKGNANM